MLKNADTGPSDTVISLIRIGRKYDNNSVNDTFVVKKKRKITIICFFLTMYFKFKAIEHLQLPIEKDRAWFHRALLMQLWVCPALLLELVTSATQEDLFKGWEDIRICYIFSEPRLQRHLTMHIACLTCVTVSRFRFWGYRVGNCSLFSTFQSYWDSFCDMWIRGFVSCFLGYGRNG